MKKIFVSRTVFVIIIALISTLDMKAQLNESLYPLIQNVQQRNVTSLNGQWKMIIDPFENGYYDHRYQPKKDGYFLDRTVQDKTERIEYNFNTSEQLSVPGDWNTQKEKLFYYEGTIWYRKKFHVQKNASQRNFLHFGAVNYEANVYLNGKKIGKHTGGFTPFNFEVTEELKNGENTLIVKVDNKRLPQAVPTVNTDWWNYGGITRDVRLVTLASTFIRDYSIQLKKGSTKEIEGYVQLDGEDKNPSVVLRIPELDIERTIKIKDGKGSFSFTARPELWSPNTPKLYEVQLQSGQDKVSDKIGFRTIAVQGKDILLNGKSTFLKGICMHEEAPFRSGRANSKADATTLLGWAKELGCNFVRLAHYPHNEHMIREADRLGLMLWSEIPVYWTIDWKNAETLQNAKQQLKESIQRDRNRASIIIWSVANETPVSEERLAFLKNLIDSTRELDGTRLVSAASDTHDNPEDADVHVISDPLAAHLDVIGINYYCGWYQGLPESCPSQKWENPYNKPVVISEFGAGALQGMHGDELTRWSEEYQQSVYKNNFEMFKNMDFLRGTMPWLLMDFYSSRRPLPDIQDNYNRKGLISEKGQKKKAYYTLQEYYAKMKTPQ